MRLALMGASLRPACTPAGTGASTPAGAAVPRPPHDRMMLRFSMTLNYHARIERDPRGDDRQTG